MINQYYRFMTCIAGVLRVKERTALILKLRSNCRGKQFYFLKFVSRSSGGGVAYLQYMLIHCLHYKLIFLMAFLFGASQAHGNRCLVVIMPLYSSGN